MATTLAVDVYDAIRRAARPLRGAHDDLDPILGMVGDARFVHPRQNPEDVEERLETSPSFEPTTREAQTGVGGRRVAAPTQKQR